MDKHLFLKVFRLVVVPFTVVLVAAMSAGAFGWARLSHGPILGAVTSGSVSILVRTNYAATVKLEYDDSPNFPHPMSKTISTLASSDFIAKFLADRLTASTSNWYRFWVDGMPTPGVWEFKTAPAASTASLTLAVFADFNPQNHAPSLAAMNALGTRPDLVVFLGDLDHRDPGHTGTALEALNNMRTMHKDLRSNISLFGTDFKREFIARPGRQLPLIYVWDDHDFGTNDANKSFEYRSQAIQAFREYFLMSSREEADPTEGVWQQQTYGAADIFILDDRSERDPPKRNPSDAAKSMLGAKQRRWLKNGLLSSTRKWKIILSTVPFNPSCKPQDSWGAFTDEHDEIVNFIKRNNITGVVIVSGDIHSGGAIDNGIHSGVPELSVPHANLITFADTWVKRGDRTCQQGNRCGSWSDGLICGTNNAGYGLLNITNTELVMEVRSSDNIVRKARTLY